MFKLVCILHLAAIILIGSACKNKKDSKNSEAEKQLVLIKKDTSVNAVELSKRPPIINLIDTVAIKYNVLYVKDSANSSERMSIKLEKLFTEDLPNYIDKEKLEIEGPPIVWYKSATSPFYYEAGIPVSNKPSKGNKTYFTKTIGGDSAVVAHYFGPYSKTNMAYDVLNEWVADNKKKKNGVPYEIYVSNPWNISGKTDPYKMQTDIVFPLK